MSAAFEARARGRARRIETIQCERAGGCEARRESVLPGCLDGGSEG